MNTAFYELARKYAVAFFNVFKSRMDAQSIESIKQLSNFLNTHKKVLFYVELSSLDQDGTKKAFQVILDQLHLGFLNESIIALLMKSQRLFLLPLILEKVTELYNEQQGIMAFTVVSSKELPAHYIQALEKNLAQKTGKKITTKAIVDKKLIAGIKIYSNQYGWEYSVRRQLQALRAH